MHGEERRGQDHTNRKTITISTIRTLGAILVASVLATASVLAAPFVDPLDKPAEMSPLAQYSQLIAIARAQPAGGGRNTQAHPLFR